MTWSTPAAAGALPAPRPAVLDVPVYSSAPPSAVPVAVRASSNEAPDGLSAAVREAVVARLGTANRYPALGGTDLIAAIADALGADPAEIAVADGSLSLLNYLLLAYVRPGQKVVAAWRSYEAYPICVLTAGGEPILVPNRPDHGHDLPAMLAAVDEDTAAVILCSPNNPTGVGLTHEEVAGFLAAAPSSVVVVLDEAYLDFDVRADRPRAQELLAAHANLVVLRTFSKAHGLAGLRIGYAIGHPEVIGSTRRILPAFPVGALAAAAGIAALGDDAHRQGIVAAVLEQRPQAVALLEAHDLVPADSQSNFLWLPIGERGEALGGICAELGMSTRVFPGEGIRISLGEPGLLPLLARALDAFDAR